MNMLIVHMINLQKQKSNSINMSLGIENIEVINIQHFTRTQKKNFM